VIKEISNNFCNIDSALVFLTLQSREALALLPKMPLCQRAGLTLGENETNSKRSEFCSVFSGDSNAREKILLLLSFLMIHERLPGHFSKEIKTREALCGERECLM
jgi:hypothetical protein